LQERHGECCRWLNVIVLRVVDGPAGKLASTAAVVVRAIATKKQESSDEDIEGLYSDDELIK
jgi:hypothetical protein